MSHSYTNLLVHCTFSTSGRVRFIRPEWQDRINAFIGGIARENGFRALAVGGIEDHIQVLIVYPASLEVAKAVQILKAGSSKMIRATFTPSFSWQKGYAAFGIGISQVEETVRYIRRQREHHRKHSYDDELIAFCRKHGIELVPEPELDVAS